MLTKINAWLNQRIDKILWSGPHVYGKRLVPFSTDLHGIHRLKPLQVRKQEVKKALTSWVHDAVGKRRA